MYYFNELNSLSVLSLYEGELLGKVDKLFFDKKLKKLLSLEILGENDTRLTLPTKNIYHIGKNAITVKNNQALSLKIEDTDLTVAPIGSKAYNICGEYLGVVKEISMNEKFLTEKFSLDNDTTLNARDLASSGKNTVIFYDSKTKIDVSKFTPNKQNKLSHAFSINKNTKPEDLKVETPTSIEIQPIKIEENSHVESVDSKPNQVFQSTDFLIGRVCTKDIFNFNNELLIKAHGIVNKKNLKEIKRFGKLRELMLYTIGT